MSDYEDDLAQMRFVGDPVSVAKQVHRETRAMWLIGAFVLGCVVGWLV